MVFLKAWSKNKRGGHRGEVHHGDEEVARERKC
jgi:hypothetical protein